MTLDESTFPMLRKHQGHPFDEMSIRGDDWKHRDLVFETPEGEPIQYLRLYREFKNLLRKAGFPDIRFHDLRHTAASLLLSSGVPVLVVSQRHGHAKPIITQAVYGHLMPSTQPEVANPLDGLVRG